LWLAKWLKGELMMYQRRAVLGMVLACLVTPALVGCSYLSQRQVTPAAEQGEGAVATGGDQGSAVYYDFDDVAVPSEFKLVKDSSFVYQSGSLRNGLLVFDGRVEPVSTANFVVAAMAKDNWRMKSSFKYGRTLMLFEKPGKTALISITEGITNTRLEIWVAPTPEAAAPQPTAYPLAN
jgi:hypothetical protein